MKILVLGAGGMAGHMIALRLQAAGYDVTGLARRELVYFPSLVMDIRDTVPLQQEITKYDVIINAIGILPASIHTHLAHSVWINTYLPHFLAEITKQTPTKVIHMSTDCVFSGKEQGNYTENSLCTETNYYGRTKALGELIDDKNLTFRTSIIGPDINPHGTGLFHWFMQQELPVKGFQKVIWTGVTTLELADAMDAAIQQKLTGLYHLVNNQTINKYDLLHLFNQHKKNAISIETDTTFVSDKSLVTTRTDFSFQVKSYQVMINDMKNWIIRHQSLYPLYQMTTD